MHLELKDTVTKLMTTDIKQKILDSVSSTLSTVYNIATGNTGTNEEATAKQALEESLGPKGGGRRCCRRVQPSHVGRPT